MAGEDRSRSSLAPPAATLGADLAGTIALPHLKLYSHRLALHHRTRAHLARGSTAHSANAGDEGVDLGHSSFNLKGVAVHGSFLYDNDSVDSVVTTRSYGDKHEATIENRQ
jgi:hypothetical protein